MPGGQQSCHEVEPRLPRRRSSPGSPVAHWPISAPATCWPWSPRPRLCTGTFPKTCPRLPPHDECHPASSQICPGGVVQLVNLGGRQPGPSGAVPLPCSIGCFPSPGPSGAVPLLAIGRSLKNDERQIQPLLVSIIRSHNLKTNDGYPRPHLWK
jgi:hypothetical protein